MQNIRKNTKYKKYRRRKNVIPKIPIKEKVVDEIHNSAISSSTFASDFLHNDSKHGHPSYRKHSM